MVRYTLLAAVCAFGFMTAAQAAPPGNGPQLAPPGPGEQVFKSSTLSAEPYEPKTTLEVAPTPNCQLKIGSDWSETPTETLEACAALLDQKTPAQPQPMTTAYWNNLYLSADDKNIYKSDPQSSAWTVLRPRHKR